MHFRGIENNRGKLEEIQQTFWREVKPYGV